MRYLLDTHLLIWMAQGRSPLPPTREQALRAQVEAEFADLHFSALSIWEVAIKRALRRPDFDIEPVRLIGLLSDAGFHELAITAHHTMGVADLPRLHSDAIDRLLIAQAMAEGLTLLTADRQIARYPGPIRLI